MLRLIAFSTLILFNFLPSSGQVYNVKLMSWNLLNYPDVTIPNDTGIRNPYFRSVMQYTTPEILVTLENTSASSVTYFLNNVLNANGLNTYSAGSFIDGYDTDNAIFFRSSFFQFISNTVISTSLRNINEFQLLHISTGKIFRIYACHLKAGSTVADQSQRAAEIASLRAVTNALPAGSEFIVCGDFNTYSSTEPCYQALLQDNLGDDGNFLDPISMTGSWSQPVYSLYQTQSTRQRSFGGGATGGLDDRFDMILYSNAVAQSGGITYITNSTTVVGNDGWHHNDSINQQPNPAVPVAIANALHYASDHLPVTAVFTVATATGIHENESENIPFGIHYSPGSSSLSVQYSLPYAGNIAIQLTDMDGRLLKKITSSKKQPGSYSDRIIVKFLTKGTYVVKLFTGTRSYSQPFSIY